MALNSKIIGGLAWTGLVLVLAVPSADLVSSQLSPKSSLAMTADTDQVQTGSISDPVDAFVQSGKPLPSYISDAPAAPAPTVKILPPISTTAQQPAPVTVPSVPATLTAETDVAEVQPIAPVPYPANLRPKAPVVTDPIVTSSVGGEEVAALPEAAVPPTGRPKASVEPRYVTEEELADWDSGSLAEYLESRGLIEEAAYNDGSNAGYDPDGFFLNEGPNNNRTIRSRSRRDGEGFFFVPN
jgi:hypothetical protein